ncbi:MAG: LCP family protein, partial [Clostridia bacterium]|nr:LCP family protein [Clostridia bacterium]
ADGEPAVPETEAEPAVPETEAEPAAPEAAPAEAPEPDFPETLYDTVSYNPDETVESEVGGEFVNFDDADQPGQGPASFIDQTEIPEEELSADALRKKFATYNDPDALEWDNDEDPEDREDAEDSEFLPADETDGRAKKSLRRWFTSLSKPRKIILIVALVLVALLLIAGVAGGLFVHHKLSLMGEKFNKTEDYGKIYEEDTDMDSIAVDIGGEGFRSALKQWATSGNDAKLSSKNVINVLLIGCDEGGGNTDTMLLVSLNKKTQKITMVSFLRDSYLYIENGENSHCTKLNAAYSIGGEGDAGAKKLIETIENNYKITIDNYALVNFDSFSALVDVMGGVTVDVPEFVANYINRRWQGAGMPYGDGVTLTGFQALCFCRARHCYNEGDVGRAQNQRNVIDSMLSRAQNASLGELNKYVNTLLPYVMTGYSSRELISLGTAAVTKGWAGYSRTELQMPTPETRISGSENMWIWVADYKTAAHDLQEALYGKSNIVLTEGEQTLIDIYNAEGGSSYTPSPAAPATPATPATTAPVTEAPAIEEPETEAPATEAPA